MTERRTLRRTLDGELRNGDSDDYSDWEMLVEEVEAHRQNLHPNEVLTISFDSDYDSSYATMKLHAERLETDEEFAARLAQDEVNRVKVAEQAAARERAQLRTLVDKYGLPETIKVILTND